MSESQEERSPSVVDILRTHYPKAALPAVVVAMLWIRLQAYDTFLRDGEVYLSGNDAWYHLRQVNYTIQNWPGTMPYDPWTGFPYGNLAGQFGTLYDQLIATAALVVGLGDPSQELIAKTLLVAPAVFGALVALPTYAVGKRLGGRLGGIFAAVVLMLLPGTFLRRGLVGFADHNVAEPLFMLIAVLATMIALTVADRERPVWELVADRDIDALRDPLKWSALAGAAIALYMWVWPPGILLVGITGVYFLVQMVASFVRDDSPEHIAFVAAVSMPIAAVLMAARISEPGFGVTGFTLLQVLLPLAVGGGAVLLAWLARVWESQDLERNGYPVAVAGLVAVSLGLFSIALPGVFGGIISNFLNTVGFSATAGTRTIGEAQPFLDPGILQQRGLTASGRIVSEYGFTFFSGLLASIWLAAKPLIKSGDTRKFGYFVGALGVVALIFLVPAIPDGLGSALGAESSLVSLTIVTALILGGILQADYDPEKLFVLVWIAFITSAAFTQVRFNYYLAPGVAVMNAYLVGQLVNSKYLGIPDIEAVSDIDGYQALAVVAAILLILGPVLFVPISVGNTTTQTAWDAAEQTGPGSVTVWDGPLGWMQENTPEEGNLGGAGNADQMDYYGTYEYTDDFEYPDGAYGVMSWWDYGHWITLRGERIPNANPFQQGADTAANFLLAPNETQSEDVLTSQSTEGNQTRYVMVDWQMATPGSKFGAPTVFYDAEENVSRSDFLRTLYRFDYQNQGRFVGTTLRTQRFYNSTMTKLYYYHGSARSPSPIVVDWEPRQVETGSGEAVTIDSNPRGEAFVRTFNNMSAAREYVEEDGTAQVGGLGSFPSERVEALEHYRLVQVSDTSASNRILRTVGREAQIAGANPQATVPADPAWVKTFERVPGATVEGSGAPANTTVTASTELRIPNTNSTFTYTQRADTDANGNFEMTLPYATTGYDDYGPDNGYTNVSVRATGPYTVSTPATLGNNGSIVSYRANLSVPEGEVNGDGDGEIGVELDRNEEELTIGGGSGGDGSTDGGSGDSTSADGSGSETQSLREPAVAGDAARAA
ncbi:oligosaccharyl transferase [Halobellus salinus]|uniref:dolichyl-phosphooligosaccharide-protein glycotransferase n=1 Tax=Halobellus salinus TaxID=931585 RepID=A0A830E8H9_9EURY|nr:oligosaccharyl transferase, archaeosortase A system-associated [Halobellus salinus]GGJ01877.1 oligosaccharyl transferase [Halobellus salinus]SMP18124.1 dolichyl-diphosphooligosaccharide--protein glycosyltransferase [Halobellus salinus]